MPARPGFSVVIPARNEERYLYATLEAIGRQARRPDEVIVVDSASTDRTAALARAWGARVVRCDTPGVALARQKGLEAARYRWVATTDADSRPETGWLAAFEAAAPGTVGLYGSLALCDRGRPLEVGSERAYRAFLRVMNWLDRPNLAGANMAFNRQVALEVGGYGTAEAGEDVTLGRALHAVGVVAFVPGARVLTSARRLEGGLGRFLGQQARNLMGRPAGYFTQSRRTTRS
ncbi:glycosyltransferase involved in cell wall biosynthesis [Deinobacterium chartae]|uniref:Glycosyltransferase involved in cell wall biosynthesis n=1 Tax=Deinobacterium chartae TaxID=521158 RepID=A0A841I7L9_9DEIO|nr:glycosyltransferase family A protein [Deinobacterium chartae]MBB6099805.1 glycosyltransferase involved in cell wall biosynthesis [Deinobacterium chartae]